MLYELIHFIQSPTLEARIRELCASAAAYAIFSACATTSNTSRAQSALDLACQVQTYRATAGLEAQDDSRKPQQT